MKKLILLSVLATLCLKTSLAQTNNSPTLKIGDHVPKEILNHSFANEAEGFRFSGLKGKWIILDFWASWCSPCIGMMPLLETLQKENADNLQIIKVTYQSKEDVAAVLKRLGNVDSKLLSIYRDSVLIPLFPHSTLPHFVWVDPSGKVTAITGGDEVNQPNITQMVKNSMPDLRVKIDAGIAPYDNQKPLFIDGNGGNGSSLIYHSILSGFCENLTGGNYFQRTPEKSVRKITCRNMTIPNLFALALGEGKVTYKSNRIWIKTKDTTALRLNRSKDIVLDWMREHTFCYELVVPPKLYQQAFTIMLNDLNRHFSEYKATVVKRKMECLVLQRTKGNDLLNSNGDVTVSHFDQFHAEMKNVKFLQLPAQLNNFYFQLSPYPVIDETGYSGNVDIDIQGNLSNPSEVDKLLRPYNLSLTKAVREVDVVLIEDNDKVKQILPNHPKSPQ